MTQPPAHDYDALLHAVSETERGRWFLAEFARRHRAADTKALLAAIHRLEAVVKSHSPAGDSAALAKEFHAMAEALKMTEAEMRAVRSDRLPDEGAVAAGKTAFEDIAGRAEALGHDLLATAQSLHDKGERLRQDPATAGPAADLGDDLDRLIEHGWNQALLSERIVKAMDLLGRLQARIRESLEGKAELIEDEAPAEETDEPAVTGYFEEDRELFAGERAESAEAGGAAAPLEPLVPTSEEKQRIVVIRKPASAETPIPLEDTSSEDLTAGG